MDRVGLFGHMVRRHDRLPASFTLHAILRQYRPGDALCDPEAEGELVQIRGTSWPTSRGRETGYRSGGLDDERRGHIGRQW